MLKERDDEMVMKQYAEFAEKRRLKKLRSDAITMTKSAYIKERGEERTARYTGRIDVATQHDDRKMKAFAASCYSDNRLPNEIDKLMTLELREIAKHKKQINDDLKRKDFLIERVKEHGPRGFGRRGFIDESAEEKVIAGIVVGPERISSRSKGMKVLVNDEIATIMDGVVERALHDFRGHKLKERFAAFNKEKDESRSAGILSTLAARETKMERAFGVHGRGRGGVAEPPSPLSKGLNMSRTSPSPERGKDSPSKWHTGEKKGQNKKKPRRFKDYKYPVGINDNPMDFLNENLDDMLAYADEKAKKEAAAKLDEENSKHEGKR
jgi:hypothetical protein